VHLHPETHVRSSETIRDVVIGMSDGLTVPFALAAGVSGAAAGTSLVITAGVAEIAAGAIAMGLGGYLAARTEADHYRSEYRREVEETEEIPDEERAEVERIFTAYGLKGQPLQELVGAITRDPTIWVEFMMRFELGLEPPDARRAPVSALTIGASYILGGIIPLAPYLFVHDVSRALVISAAMTLLALFVFGALKGKLTGVQPFASGLQAAAIGGLAAGVAFMLARLIAG
jgi:VIT1/CCC1 family predicted Fe2+/Mn2+ transporter